MFETFFSRSLLHPLSLSLNMNAKCRMFSDTFKKLPMQRKSKLKCFLEMGLSPLSNEGSSVVAVIILTFQRIPD